MYFASFQKRSCQKTLNFNVKIAWLVQAEEEVRDLQKKMQQLENDLDQTQEKLMAANQRLEEKEKALQNVSF